TLPASITALVISRTLAPAIALAIVGLIPAALILAPSRIPVHAAARGPVLPNRRRPPGRHVPLRRRRPSGRRVPLRRKRPLRRDTLPDRSAIAGPVVLGPPQIASTVITRGGAAIPAAIPPADGSIAIGSAVRPVLRPVVVPVVWPVVRVPIEMAIVIPHQQEQQPRHEDRPQ